MPARPVISFRVDPDMELKLLQLKATFPRQEWAEVFNWFFQQPAVKDAIREKVTT